jgi:hypothetical protein
VAFVEIPLENGGFLVTLFKGAFLSFRKVFFAAFLFLTACNAHFCSCYTVAASFVFYTEVQGEVVLAEDGGTAPGPPFACAATMTGTSNTISYDIEGMTCAKTGGDGPDATGSNGCTLESESDGNYLDAAVPPTRITINLNDKDQEFMGGLYFKLHFVCTSGDAYNAPPIDADEAFETYHCDG